MLKLKHLINWAVGFLFLMTPTLSYSLPKCSDVFPSALGSFNDKQVVMERNTEVSGQLDSYIYTNNLDAHSSAECDGSTCLEKRSEPATITKPSFSNPKRFIGTNEKLSGDYEISGSLALYPSNFELAGPTRIYVSGSIAIYGGSDEHDAQDLIIFVEGDAKIYKYRGNDEFSAFIYSNSLIEIDKNMEVSGAFTAGNDLKLLQGSEVEYIAPESSNFDGICETTTANATPIAEFRFDKFYWASGVNSEVLDSLGGNHGTAFNTQPTEGFMCNAADLSLNGISDYIELDSDLLDGTNDFSVIAWIKTEDANSRVLLSGANAFRDNEFTTWFNSPTQFQAWLVNATSNAITIPNIADNNWHQFAWTRQGSTGCLYIDSQLRQCVAVESDVLSIENLILGQEQDSNGGGFDPAQAWNGLVDELLIFDSAVTATQITQIYNYQTSGLGWDGAARDTYCGANGWWQLENNFLDANLAQALDLTAVGNPEFSQTSPEPANVIGNKSTCYYAKFDGNSYAVVDDSGTFNYDELTVSAWVYPTSYPTSDLRSIVSKDEHFEFHINSQGRLFWWWQDSRRRARSFSSSRSLPVNQWTHVAVSYQNGEQKMYINGALDSQRSFTRGLADSPCNFYIGTDVGTNTASQCGAVRTDRNFEGNLDEVRIYSRVLSATEISADMNTVRSCAAANELNHYRLTLSDNQGLTCESETLKLEACSNDDCSTYFSDTVTLGLQPQSMASLTWPNGNPVTFNEITTITVSNSVPTQINYLLDNAVTSPSSVLRCFIGTQEVLASQCYTAFEDTGFKITGLTSDNILDQIAGVPFDAYLQAVKTDESGACTTLFNGQENINFQMSHQVPNTDEGMEFSINNTPVGVTPSSVSVVFDPLNDYKAPLSINYNDAGAITFSASKVVATGKELSDTTLPFVVRPQQFVFELADNHQPGDASYATDALSSVFLNAGQDFSVKIKAINANGDTTLNFEQAQIVANAFALSHQLQAPTAGSLGDLTFESINFVNGEAQFNANYDEVGIISLLASLNASDYLNHQGGGAIGGQMDNIGRFVPANFAMINQQVVPGCDVFTYQSQPYARVQYGIEALNLDGDRTLNYIANPLAVENYAKANISNLIENDAIDAAMYKSASNLASRYSLTEPVWQNGLYAVDVSDAILARDYSQLNVGAMPEAPMSDVYLLSQLSDPDGRQLLALNQNSEQYGGVPNSKAIAGPLEIRFGRLVVDNNYGSENEALQIPIRAEYWDGTNYRANLLDSCTPYIGSRLAVQDAHTYQGSDGILSQGYYLDGSGFYLDAPGINRSFDVYYQSPDEWLRFDWNNDGNFNDVLDNPLGVIQFGRYRGNERVIYWQETR